MAETSTNANVTGETLPSRHVYQLPGFWPVVVFALTLATHLYYIVETVGHPFFNYPLVDSRAYHEQAWDILRRGWLGDKIFWQAPLYPYFLAVCYQFISVEFFDARVIQAVLAAVNAVLLYVIARGAVGRGVAIGAGVAVAFYGPLIYFDAEMLAPVLVILSYMLMALALERAMQSGRLPWWLAAGALNGFSALAHGLALLTVPLVSFYVVFGRRMRSCPLDRRFSAIACYVIGAAAMILPVAVRNRMVGGEWVLISHNGPINLYIGNHPDYDRVVGLRPGLEWSTLQRQLEEKGIKTLGEEARYFTGATLDNICRNPRAVGRVWLKKLRLFFHADEIKRNYPIYPMRQYSDLMAMLLWKWRGPGGVVGLGFPFGVVLPLAVVGWWTLRRRGVRLVAVELIMVGHFAANMLFFMCSRYRVPLAPFFVLYAAATVHWAISERIWQRAALRHSAPLLTVALAVFLFSNAGLKPMGNAQDRGEYELYLGIVAHKHRKEPLEALAHYQAALRNIPDLIEAQFLLGILYGDFLDQQARAVEQFDWVLERDPGNMPVMFNKAIALARHGDRVQAIKILQTLVESDPGNQSYKEAFERLSGKETESPSGNRTWPDDHPSSTSQKNFAPSR